MALNQEINQEGGDGAGGVSEHSPIDLEEEERAYHLNLKRKTEMATVEVTSDGETRYFPINKFLLLKHSRTFNNLFNGYFGSIESEEDGWDTRGPWLVAWTETPEYTFASFIIWIQTGEFAKDPVDGEFQELTHIDLARLWDCAILVGCMELVDAVLKEIKKKDFSDLMDLVEFIQIMCLREQTVKKNSPYREPLISSIIFGLDLANNYCITRHIPGLIQDQLRRVLADHAKAKVNANAN